MKTIAKNRTAKIEALFTTGRDFKVYSLSNYFVAEPVSAECVRTQLNRFRFAKLQDMGNGQYIVRVTSNEWYRFSA